MCPRALRAPSPRGLMSSSLLGQWPSLVVSTHEMELRAWQWAGWAQSLLPFALVFSLLPSCRNVDLWACDPFSYWISNVSLRFFFPICISVFSDLLACPAMDSAGWEMSTHKSDHTVGPSCEQISGQPHSIALMKVVEGKDYWWTQLVMTMNGDWLRQNHGQEFPGVFWRCSTILQFL